MNGPLERGRASPRALNYGIAASLVIHAVLLFLVSLDRESARAPASPGPIVARLVAPPQPAPAPQPEPPKPRAPEPPAPVVKPAPIVKPAPVVKPAPEVKPSPIPLPAPQPPQKATPESSPRPVPQPPIPQQVPGPTAPVAPSASADASAPAPQAADVADRKALINRYGIQLKLQMRKYNQYPRVALDNNWEGKGELVLVIGPNGMIAEVRIVHSTGYEILDKAMAENVRKAKPLVPIPEGLRGREFSIEIPYEWRLVDAR